MSTIAELAPQSVWKHFYALTQVPRPSGYLEPVQQFLLDFGKKIGVETFMDDAGNIIMRKPATPGLERSQGYRASGTHGYGAPEDRREHTRL